MTVRFDNVLDNGQAKAGTGNFFGSGSAAVGPKKPLKNAPDVLLGNANSVVFD
jgi:hypothetical protein